MDFIRFFLKAKGAWVLSGCLAACLVFSGCKENVFDNGIVDRDQSVDSCTVGGTRCDNNAVQTCKQQNGKATWVDTQTCTRALQVCKKVNGAHTCVTLPSCTDNKTNLEETDVDCGGSQCPACDNNNRCKIDRDCKSKVCAKGVCMPCRAGSFSCLGNYLRRCKGDNSGWDNMQTCDPKQNEACDAKLKKCEKLKPTGSPKPTGTYYLFGYFEKGASDFRGGYDVDGYGDRLYVNNSRKLDVYQVTLKQGVDGKADPNQHPDNPKKKGPIVERQLKYLKTYPNVSLGSPSVGEIYAEKDRVYFLKEDSSVTNLYEYDFATGKTTIKVKGTMRLCCVGFDEQARQWFFAHNSSNRVVYAYWPKGAGIAAEFWYPDLAGSHLDGMEVVTDPKTKRSYVYVSDMTSDFLAQWYFDRDKDAWVQMNVFKYDETKNQYVEGMGFGAFQHFWATSGKALYEVGGGDLQKYVGIK